MKGSIKGLLMAVVLIVGTTWLAGCSVSQSVQDTQVPAAVQVGNETLLWGPEIKEQALSMIQHSTIFCHLTMYELSDPDILDALVAAAHRHVDVKVVLDATEPHSKSIALPMLLSHHIFVRTLKISGGISHIKSLVTDGASGMQELIGGMNFGQYSWENHDASVFFAHPNMAFEGLFQQDYARAGGDPESPLSYSLPLLDDEAIEPAMLQAIGRARQCINMEAFAFTSKDIVSALEAAVGRNVQVEVILDKQESYNHTTANELLAAGIHVVYYTPYQGEYLHAKILSVDRGRFLFIGSANFSYHGFSVNHEGDVELFHATAFAASVDADVAMQYSRGTAV